MKPHVQLSFNFKDLIKYSTEAKAQRGGFLLPYMVDLMVCARRYKMTYKEYSIYQFYNLSADERGMFLMMSDAQVINRLYNLNVAPMRDTDVFKNKALFVESFKAFTKRPFINLETAGLKRFSDFVKLYPFIVSKSTIKKDGDFVEKHEITESTDIELLRKELIEKKEFLIEPYLNQAKVLQDLYPESLNTLRVITFRDEDGEVHILNVALKLGSGGMRDNYSRGGLFSVPDENGVIVRPFVNKKGSVYETHPSTQAPLMGFQIPRFNEALEFALECADVIPSVRYVGWDIAILEDTFLLLDGTLESKFFQTPPVVTQSIGEEIHNLRGVYEYVMPALIRHKKKSKTQK